MSRSPGSNPHEDRRNWRPAETVEDYLRNCREGLSEAYRKVVVDWLNEGGAQ